MTIDDLISKLTGVERRGRFFSADCPLHLSDPASLTVRLYHFICAAIYCLSVLVRKNIFTSVLFAFSNFTWIEVSVFGFSIGH